MLDVISTSKVRSYDLSELLLLFTECGSPAFDEFLETLGQKVRMKGFNRYRAQLDHKSKWEGYLYSAQIYRGREGED